jgi:hypothetical protein
LRSFAAARVVARGCAQVDSNTHPGGRVSGRFRVTGFEGVTYRIHSYVNPKGGDQMHAEPNKFLVGEGAGPFRLVIASQYGNCPHHRGGWGKRQ